MPTSAPTARTRVVREPQRGVYDREIINQILNEAFICHVGFVVDDQPFVIPTAFGRVGDNLYIHGSAASRMLKQLSTAVPVCVTVTLVDGLVLARSVFNHSMNYRSVVVLGSAELVSDPEEKIAALHALSEHIIPGRWDQSRQPNERELKATSVLKVGLSECSAKVRTGPPIDDEDDYSLPVWAGVIPLELVPRAAIADPKLPPEIPVPENVAHYSRIKR
ncbi:MAG: pyridoxamine 5'-phosphate oxidase family protein [Terriglobales bacterium]